MEIGKMIKELEKYSNHYCISFQFWGEGNNNVWIYDSAGDVELFCSGGNNSVKEVLKAALDWIKKVNKID